MSSEKKQRRSMNSTTYMSMRRTQQWNLSDDPNNSNLSYANIPMKKQLPEWNQSSATWRNSSPKFAFPKNTRFSVDKASHLDIIQLEIPSTRSPVACTFGKGKRHPISIVTLRNAKEKPAPDRYSLKNLDQATRTPDKGKTFGIGWSQYEKVYIDWRKDNYSAHFSVRNPPAMYNVREIPGEQAKKMSMHERLKMYTEKMSHAKRHIPGPVHDVKERNLSLMVGMNQRSFGVGERIDFGKPANEYPAAKYQILGFADHVKAKSQKI